MSGAGGSFAEMRRRTVRVRSQRRTLTLVGAALVAAAILIVAYPMISPVVLGALTGWLLWLAGALMIAVSLLVGARRSLAVSLIASFGAIGSGAFLLLNPWVGAVAAALLIAAVLILEGAFELALAFDLRPARAWRWLIASAIASVLAGVVIIGGAAGSRVMLAWLLGVSVASSGLALIAIARPRPRRYSAARARSASWSEASPRTPST